MHAGPWRTVSAGRWQREETMPILECRSLVWALRHRLRSSASFGQRCLFLTDSLTQALALSKGRSPSSPMNGICRFWGAMCLASGTLASVRWIPGEVNAADPPSRVWQPHRHGEWEKSAAKRRANKDKDMNMSFLVAESSFDRARDFMFFRSSVLQILLKSLSQNSSKHA